MHTEFCWKNLKGREQLKDLVVDGRIILNRSLGNRVGGCKLDASG